MEQRSSFWFVTAGRSCDTIPETVFTQSEAAEAVGIGPQNSQHSRFEAVATMLAQELINRSITVRFADDPDWGFRGCYGSSELTINVRTIDPIGLLAPLPNCLRDGYHFSFMSLHTILSRDTSLTLTTASAADLLDGLRAFFL